MHKKKFLPFLTDDQGHSLSVDNNIVVTMPIPDPLEQSPEGWEDNSIQYSRNKDLKGVIVQFITDLIFHFDGARILREYFYNKGIESTIFFIWLKLNQVFGGGMVHEDWYKGQPDFSTFKDGANGVQLNLMPGGIYKDYQSNRNVTYEFPFKDDPATISLLLDGTYILQRTNWIITDGDPLEDNIEFGNHSLGMDVISEEGLSSVETYSQPRKVINGPADLHDVKPFHVTGAGSENIEIEYSMQFYITLATGISPNPLAGSVLLLWAINKDDPNDVLATYFIKYSGTGAGLYNRYWNLSDTVAINNVPPNANLYFAQVVTISDIYNYAPGTQVGSGTGSPFSFLGSGDDSFTVKWIYTINENSFFKLKNKYLFQSTIVPAFRVFDLGDKLIDKLSSGKSSLLSDLLNNDQNLVVTCGDAIRGIKDPVLKTNFDNYKKSVDAVRCVGIDIEGNDMRIESRYDDFNNTEITNLGPAKIPNSDFVTPANEYRWSKIKAGYPNVDTENVNGKYSFLNEYEFKTPVETVDNTYEDCFSSYGADPYVIELLRISTYGKDTTDNISDNSIFFLDAEPLIAPFTGTLQFIEGVGQPTIVFEGVTGMNLQPGTKFRVTSGLNAGIWTVGVSYEQGSDTYVIITGFLINETIDTTVIFEHYKLRRLPYASIEGVVDAATLFNVELSVARILSRHKRWIHGGCDNMEGKYITFQTTGKNDQVATTDGTGVVIREKDDILIGSMGTPVFKPYYLNMQVKTPFNLKNLLDANHKGFMRFQADTVDYKGFPEDIKCNDATLEIQDYRLLSTADNDFTKRAKA